MSTRTEPSVVTPDHLRQYHEEGYCILEGVIPPEEVEALTAEVDRYIAMIDARMDAMGSEVVGINHKGKRYFIPNQHWQSDAMSRFIFSDLMADLTRRILGDWVYLFHDQWVVKAAEAGSSFAWHQDSGYIPHAHPEYLTCWCTLTDVNEDNGTVYVLPRSRAGVEGHVEHVREDVSNDLVGYHGDDPGEPVIVPAGSIAAFSSHTFHRSGANRTPRMRPVYVVQYSPRPIMTEDGEHIWAQAIPFIKAGTRMRAYGEVAL